MKARVGIVGGTGYTGGELVRLLCFHPMVEVSWVTSRSQMGQPLHSLHPNLRGFTRLNFAAPDAVEDVDIIFLCLPHGEASKQIDLWAGKAAKIVDLSADFRLKSPEAYKSAYGHDHPKPQWLEKFVYGLPELHREDIKSASYVSGVGCNATATNLALLPVIKAELVDTTKPVITDIKVGSSEGGASASSASHHPERSGAVRTFAAAGHRHEAEVHQMVGMHCQKLDQLHMTVTSIEMVRGVLATVHCFLKQPLAEKDLWKAYRAVANSEPFIRVVKSATGIHRVPEPKILAGSNLADLGFALAADGQKATLLCALDNLMKGAAGSAVQCMNLMMGWQEDTALTFPGLHP